MAQPHETEQLERVSAAALAAELRAVLGALKRRLRGQADLGELSWSQLAVLGQLDREGPATVTSLARAEGVRPQSMGATIAALEAAGFVRGEADPNDGRQTLLSLTESCRKWLAAGRAARQDWLSGAIAAKLTEAEQQDVARALGLLRRVVDS
jgi:DNA-binding MarR family transcriptional regulator